MDEFTLEGLLKLKKELEFLKTAKRKEIAESLKHAIAFGDLKENAAYHEAKESQGFLEGKILELERILRNANVIKKSNGDTVCLGSRVLFTLDQEQMELEIVGANETDPSKGKISSQSPLGQELMGKRKGQTGQLKTSGARYKILEVN